MEGLGLVWRKFFASWPPGLAHTGVIVGLNGDQTPFVSFLLSENVLLLERPAPDSVGGRKVLIPYSRIDSVKVVEPVSNDVFVHSGFIPSRSATPDS